jgi:hypothetical protein
MNAKSSKNDKIHAFLKGFMSAFNISGQGFISIPDIDAGFQQDSEALQGDWRRVGDDIRHAMNTISNAR